MNISREDGKRVMAIGDGANDLEMFSEACLRVAVRNAIPQLARMADYIAPTNDEDGVAIALNGLVFGDRTAVSSLKRRGT